MKKLLLLLVGLVVAFAAGAQDYSSWYVNVPYDGNSWGNNGKNPTNGIASQDLAIGTGKFAIKVWDGSDDHWYAKSGQIDQNTWVALDAMNDQTAAQNANMTIKGATSGQTFTVEFDCATNKVKVTPQGGGDVDIITYEIHGQLFGNASWSTEKFTQNGDNWEWTGKLNPVGDKKFGVRKCKNGSQDDWIEGNNANIAETNTVYSFKNEGSNSQISFSVNPADDYTIVYNPVAQTICFKHDNEGQDTYAYYLYKTSGEELGQFTGNPYEFTYNISTALAADTPLCVRRVKNGTENTDYTLSSALTYDGTAVSNQSLQEGNSNLTLKKALKGAVKFALSVSDNVPATLSISGGSLDTPVTTFKEFHLIGKFNGWDQTDYSKAFTTTDGKTYTLTLKDAISGEFKVKVKAENTWFGVNDNNGRSFNQTFDLNGSENITMSEEIPAGKTITFTYNENGTSTLFVEGEAVIVDPAPDHIYMHVKYDLEEYGKNGVNTPLYCQYYNTGNTDKSEVKTMTLESDRYSLWKAPLSQEEAAKYNAVKFWFEKSSGTANYDSYKDSGNEVIDSYDSANWAKYIYATSSRGHNGTGNYEYAVQSYLTYKKFQELDQLDIDNGGRRNLYLVGWGKSTDTTVKPFKYYDDNKIEQTMPGEVANALKLNEDNGCFYLTILPDGGSFKMSWISVADAIAGYTATDSQREWATFDLGLIGVQKDYAYPKEEYKPDYKRGDGVNGKVYFVRNRSVRYMNYNQADWVLPDNTDELPGVGRKRWLVVDTHCAYQKDGKTIDEANSCKTVTITSFDPNPSVEVKVSGVQPRTEPLDKAVAERMHHECLNGADDNGHIYMQNVNYAVADVTINATNIADVVNSSFSRVYTLYVNDNPVGTHSGTNLENLHIDYFPLSYDPNGNSMSVRAKYTDANTTLSFHSRTGKGTVDTDVSFKAPEKETLTGQYIYEGKADDGKEIYGVYVKGLDMRVADNVYNVYSDFKFDCGSQARFIEETHPIHKVMGEAVPAWGDWTFGKDWSSKLMADRNLAPLFINDVVRVENFDELKALDDKKITCTLYAVYPFMYNPKATFTVNASPASAPAKAAGDPDFSDFKVFNTAVPTSFTFTINATNAVSGVADVVADGADEAEAVYYTISGVRVDGDPAPGIYVRVCGDKVEKVVVR